jgi:hypothetical protein
VSYKAVAYKEKQPSDVGKYKAACFYAAQDGIQEQKRETAERQTVYKPG